MIKTRLVGLLSHAKSISCIRFCGSGQPSCRRYWQSFLSQIYWNGSVPGSNRTDH